MQRTTAAQSEIPKKKCKKRTKRIIIFIICAIVLSNPGMIPFLPTGVKVTILKALNRLFGDVSEVTSIIVINPTVIAQLVFMTMGVMAAWDLVDVFLSNRRPKDRHMKTLIRLYLSFSKYLFAFIGILWGLSIIGISPGMIFAGVSIVAMVVSFSAEELIADIVTGVLMVFEKECSVGDIIEVDGYRGTVKDVKLRTTVIRDQGGNDRIVNNSNMRNIINRSADISKAVCDVELADSCPLDKVEAVVADAAKAMENSGLAENVEYKGIQKIGKDTMTVRVEADVFEEDVFDVQRHINRELLSAFQSSGIKGTKSERKNERKNTQKKPQPAPAQEG